jgi:hypothetical protein
MARENQQNPVSLLGHPNSPDDSKTQCSLTWQGKYLYLLIVIGTFSQCASGAFTNQDY